jgi:hypothetical protein
VQPVWLCIAKKQNHHAVSYVRAGNVIEMGYLSKRKELTSDAVYRRRLAAEIIPRSIASGDQRSDVNSSASSKGAAATWRDQRSRVGRRSQDLVSAFGCRRAWIAGEAKSAGGEIGIILNHEAGFTTAACKLNGV